MGGNPDIQYFAADGRWVKPLRADRVDVVLRGGEGGGATYANAKSIPADVVHARSEGQRGHLSVFSYAADDLPGVLTVTIGKGGRPGGRDGYAIIITHLAGPESLPPVRGAYGWQHPGLPPAGVDGGEA